MNREQEIEYLLRYARKEENGSSRSETLKTHKNEKRLKAKAQYVLLNSYDTSVIYGMIRCIQKLRITGAEQLNVDELIQVASNIMSNLKGGLKQTEVFTDKELRGRCAGEEL